MIRVIGVGSRRGDDAAGLAAVEALSEVPLPPGVELRTCECPGPGLVDEWQGADTVVLVDATRPDGEPGAVRRLRPEDLRGAERLSSHAFGVAESLALADALGRLPARVELIGIEAADAEGEPGAAPCEAVRRGVEQAVRMTAELVEELHRDGSARTAGTEG